MTMSSMEQRGATRARYHRARRCGTRPGPAQTIRAPCANRCHYARAARHGSTARIQAHNRLHACRKHALRHTTGGLYPAGSKQGTRGGNGLT